MTHPGPPHVADPGHAPSSRAVGVTSTGTANSAMASAGQTENDPENTNGMNSLAFVYCRLEKNYTEALALVKKALTREPKNPSYLDTLGMIYANRGNTAAARKTLKKALELAPGHPEIMAHLTRI